MEKIVNGLYVTVSYKVGISGLTASEDVLKELRNATMECDEIYADDHRYPELSDWLATNIKEGRCYEWSAEINHYTIEDNNDNKNNN